MRQHIQGLLTDEELAILAERESRFESLLTGNEHEFITPVKVRRDIL